MAVSVEKKIFGKAADGREVELYVLKNGKGMTATITNLGAIIVKLEVPDSAGKLTDVVLGFDSVEKYYKNPSFFGAVIGPSANRVGGASFELNGVRYQLDVNDNENNLHSHFEDGYHKQLWDAEIVENGVKLSIEDKDGNMGFPGNKKMQVTYTLDEENGLALHYHASSDKATILNPTNHTYFNLNGHDSGAIKEHTLWLKASKYTPVVEGAIPTGELAAVESTPMDFTAEKVIGKEIDAEFEQLGLTGGYDHNWVIDDWNGELQHMATVKAPGSGREMRVYTTLPGVQFYAGNAIVTQEGKQGATYSKRCGLCLETQYFPDTIHHENFPSCVFGGEKEYDSVTVYRFV